MNQNFKQNDSFIIKRIHQKTSKFLKPFLKTLSFLYVSCEFAGQKCAPDDFQVVYTDFGGCFIFNWKPDRNLIVSDTGSNIGLKVTLNLEQYEYMPGMYNTPDVVPYTHY